MHIVNLGHDEAVGSPEYGGIIREAENRDEVWDSVRWHDEISQGR